MVDQQKLDAEINLLQKKIETAFSQLNEIDSLRADAKNLSQFQELTMSSNIILQNLMTDFHQILAYVLLAKKSGHNSVFFKSLLKRVCFMEELLHSFFKERKKQISLVSPLLKKKSGDEIKEEKINGNIIHEGQIIEANAGLVWQENQTLPLT